jgi:hypothetical protein
MKPSPQSKATPSSTLVPTTPVSSTGWAQKGEFGFVFRAQFMSKVSQIVAQ